MRLNGRLIVWAFAVFTTVVAVRVTAQGPPSTTGGQTPPAQGGGAGAGAGGQRGRGGATFPAQQRPLADAALIARGKTLYEVHCRACHGPDLRGGDMGGPNLLRSQLALNDQDGEVIAPIIRSGRPNMDPIDLSLDDAKTVAAYVRSVLASARGQGSPPAGPPVTLNLLVGDATAGQAFFAAKCSACHSATGDLQGIGTRVPDVMQLQNRWVGGSGGGRGGGGGGRGGGQGAAAAGADAAPAPVASNPRDVIVTVTLSSGQKVEGRLGRIDDFIVTLTPSDGIVRSFRRDGDVPKVEIRDPLDGHKKLWSVYTDADIHNVTAYLVTLK